MTYTTRVLTLFFLGWAVIYADRTALFPLLPAISDEMGLSAVQAGAIASAYFLAYVAVQPAAGYLGDRLGLKPILVAMVLIAGLGLTGLALFASDYSTLLLLIVVHGAGAGVYYPASFTITMYTVPPERRGLGTALINSGMSLGLAAGLVAAGPLYLATGTWRAPYLAMALPTLALAAILFLGIRPLKPRPGGAASGRTILSDRTLLCLNAGSFCSLYGFWSVVTWGPTFLQDERGLGLGASGAFTALVAVAAVPAGLLIGRLSDRAGRRPVTLVLYPLAAASIALLASARSIPVLVLALLLYGLTGKLAMDPVLVAWVGDRASVTGPTAIGAAMGVYSFAGMSSAVVAPLVNGWIKDTTGSLEGGLYLAAAVVLAGMGFAWVARECRPVSAA